jgi:ribosomal protein S18 acetylase RimI-like enzyme
MNEGEKGMHEQHQPEQAVALHRHLEQAYLALAQTFQPREWHQQLGGTWFFTNHPFPLCNGVLRTESSETEVDQLIEQIIQQAQKGKTPFLWLVGPATSPADLPERLKACGLVHDETVNGMLLNWQAFPEDQSHIPNFSLSTVKTSEQMEAWLQVFTTVFGFPDPLKQVFFNLLPTSGFALHPSCRFYLGTIDSTPVATSLLFLEEEMAGIYAVATVPSQRKLGIGTKMTRMAVEEAMRLEYSRVTLQATKMGESLYRRLGFYDVCSFQTYRWVPE